MSRFPRALLNNDKFSTNRLEDLDADREKLVLETLAGNSAHQMRLIERAVGLLRAD